MPDTPRNFLYSLQKWYFDIMQIEAAWTLLGSYGSDAIVIAVYDDGIQSSEKTITNDPEPLHPDLQTAGKIVAFFDVQRKKEDNSIVYSDHGNAVATIIAGAESLSGGVVGVNPNARLISIAQLPSDFKTDYLSDSFRWACGVKLSGTISGFPSTISNSDAADIISFSESKLGKADIKSKVFYTEELYNFYMNIGKLGIDDVVVYGREGLGTIFVSSAGNGTNNDGKPVVVDEDSEINTYKSICVGASTKYDAIGEAITDYSNHGIINTKKYIDVVAPGGHGVPRSPKSGYEPEETLNIISGSTFNGGNIPGNNNFQTAITSNVNKKKSKEVLIPVSSTLGIFKGQSVLVHTFPIDPSNIDIKIVKRISGNNIVVQGLTNSYSSGDKVTVATTITKLVSMTSNSTNTVLDVDLSWGFHKLQHIYIDLPTSIGSVEAVVTDVDYINKKLTVENIGGGPLSSSFSAGTFILVSSVKEYTVTSALTDNPSPPNITLQGFNIYDRYANLEVANKVIETNGLENTFFNGEKIGFYKTGADGSSDILDQEEYTEGIKYIRSGSSTSFLMSEQAFEEKLLLDVNNNPIIHSSGIARSRTGHWKIISGTSASTPIVSGIVSLVLTAKPNLNWIEVRQIIRDSSEIIDLHNGSKLGGWRAADGTLSTATSGVNKAVYSYTYGYGRVNALKAVQGANDYSYTSRDLMIRKKEGDLGTGSVTFGIDSPDIWVRNLDKISLADPDYINVAPTGLDPAPHQPPIPENPKKIYLRISNIGTSTTLSSLEGMSIKCFLAFTNEDEPEFDFPNKFIEKLNDPNGENIYFIGQAEIPPIPTGINNIHISEINWSAPTELKSMTITTHTSWALLNVESTFGYYFGQKIYIGDPSGLDAVLLNVLNVDHVKKQIAVEEVISKSLVRMFAAGTPIFPAHNKRSILNAYILAHVTPFDGGNTDPSLFNNNNLSYKPLGILVSGRISLDLIH